MMSRFTQLPDFAVVPDSRGFPPHLRIFTSGAYFNDWDIAKSLGFHRNTADGAPAEWYLNFKKSVKAKNK